jgi:phenylalanyl-tRNA synthetase alpha chain
VTADEIKARILTLESEFKEQIKSADKIGNYEDIRQRFLSKNAEIFLLRKELKNIDPKDRPAVGELINEAIRLFNESLEKKIAINDYEDRGGPLDLTEFIAGLYKDPDNARGHLHIVSQTQMELEDIFLSMGMEVAEGPEIESDWNNFEALNMSKTHPARSMWDTFYIDYGDFESTLLRTHTSPVQIRVMTEKKPPIYVVAPGACYRRDTPDSSHLPIFHQIEGLVVDENISFGHLKFAIESFIGKLFSADTAVRLRPSYFPFTEPSGEFDISCSLCRQKGCSICGFSGWLELGGCGMVHPNVFRNVGIDPEKYSGFAFGFGIDRIALMRYQVKDLRLLIENDIRFLSLF